MGREKHEILRLVPQPLLDVFQIGSDAPGDCTASFSICKSLGLRMATTHALCLSCSCNAGDIIRPALLILVHELLLGFRNFGLLVSHSTEAVQVLRCTMHESCSISKM